ncbi:hypothetical protein BV898_07850 [Hypsibius exemplaris]|uniref:Uncharacterized protein n=1 Tax=Hypsibius exemplaris TaxID=2072580 RepID=A0A1W0WSA5_HYPEX|nr:hypothetical protein BV898_07850 [Hypsibius exemplaris]
MEAVLSEISASVRSDSSAALWLMLRNFLKLDYWNPAEISSTLLKVCGSACSDDNLDLLERYLGVGEDLEFVPDQWGPRGSGFTALHRCCLFGQHGPRSFC